MSDKRRGLGRGLGALIPSGGSTTTTTNRAGTGTATIPPAMRPAARPVDLFFDQRPTPTPTDDDVAAGEQEVVESPDREERIGDLAVVLPDVQDDAAEGPDRPAIDVLVDADPGSDGLVDVPGARFAEIPVASITPNPRQPRTVFDEDDLAELVHSVREIGVLQPIVVRPIAPAEDGTARFELVMGERRWRATTEAGLDTIPAIVRETADDDLLRDALLENLHRSQLNPLEEAAAYQQLLEDFGCTHEELASRIGRSRPQISNTLRLMKLPPLVQRRVAAGVLSAGHARALLSLEDGAAMERVAQRVVAEGLSVRAVEEMIALGDADHTPRRRNPAEPQPELEQRATTLADRLDTRVRISMGRTRGRLTVDFAGVDDLDRILRLLGTGN
ncbi:ParB/RepB/Spo0J family partition protein [Kineococcus sp. SYSU DK001]|uniref:ParB/RepB/Spo0J family partition protein n=1 Tax=Kineococcus sp. SYSU DK001 TaxID=3383122 RepID=UPI003D7ED03C